ncbi:hypothetical protein BKM31_55335 [[Actinomadura] parvosata subsp. kistnae]|uniref:NB-ARC domain-containing protein n=1 Tax=[Actinomadura] parvosata subsp. kistnae TaxID=1909395 RepID=A0A1V0AGV9_9ACTN|nr:tetratricopeptide repeat protein [Nonomuraea sp. ATCC 55076]AQZ69440.1 hypothetical protein BKM31_55335 [Nonomuraea sp. ATCC 55076]
MSGDDQPQVRIDAHADGQARQYIAAGDQHIHQLSPPVSPEMRTLPRDMVAFTGREEELRHLTTAAAQSTGIVAIHAIDGMPGVGKTALAVRVAHLLTASYPDGQLFVDLYAHTPNVPAADPGETLGRLLARTGMDPRQIPDDLGERAARWRSRLADKKVLLILDDATGHAQVEPLLPGAPNCLVLITSRSRLIGLDGAESLNLAPLPPEQAITLFTRLAGRGTLTRADAEAVAGLVHLCGHLPLAITILAGRIAHKRAWPLHAFATEFAAATDRLGELEAGDRAVRAAFDMSYQHLPAARQRLYRHLGLHPGPDIDLYAAAALADIPLTQTRRELEALYVDHLLDEPGPGRYRLHDLLRAYTRDLATVCETAEQRERAADRLLAYYTRTAQTADSHLTRTPYPALPPAGPDPALDGPDLADRDTALAWMRTEHANLLACLEHATTQSLPFPLIELTAAMAAYLRQEGPWQQAATLHHTAANAAHMQHDPAAEATALHQLADIRYLTGEYAQAVSLFERTLKLHQQLGDHLGQAHILNNLGWVQRMTGEYTQAADLLKQALTLYDQLGHQLGQAHTLTDLGRVWRVIGKYTQAADLFERALMLYDQLGDHLGQAHALNSLGWVRRVTGEYLQAADLHERALALFEQLGDRLGQAHALTDLGRPLRITGDYAQAADLFERALALYEQLGNRSGQAHALNALGRTRHLTGKYTQAADLHERALALYEQLGNRLGQANAMQQLGCLLTRTGKHPAAADLLKRALALFRQVGDPQGEAEALNHTGALLAACAGPEQAVPMYWQALDLAQQIKSPLDEAHALEGVARCAAATADRKVAVTELLRAVEIYRRLGVPEETTAAEYLATLATM